MYVAIAFLLSLIRSKIATTDTDLADAVAGPFLRKWRELMDEIFSQFRRVSENMMRGP
jgi:hypothetical protein